MLTVVAAAAAAAIAGAARLAIKRTLRVVVVVGDYSIIEQHIHMAIQQYITSSQHRTCSLTIGTYYVIMWHFMIIMFAAFLHKLYIFCYT